MAANPHEGDPMDTDSGIDMDADSDMLSITSSNYDYQTHGRRRYHGVISSKYPLPNDTEEVIRLDDLHYMFRCHLRRNIIAPIVRNPTLMVDFGTGSGRWPIEVATEYPKCRVVGVDLSPVSPSYEIPENCDFIVADINDGLDFDDGSVDLVHSRHVQFCRPILIARVIMAGLKKEQWPLYLREVKRILKPGTGWAQCTEFRGLHLFDNEGNVPKDCAIREFEGYLQELIDELGIYWNGEHLEQNMRDAGLIDIKVKKLILDMDNWRGGRGQLAEGRRAAKRVHMGAFVALINKFDKPFPTQEDKDRFAERLKADLNNPDYHFYFDSYTVIGRKLEIKLDMVD